MSDIENKPNTVMAFFRRPIVGIAGSVASIIGFALSIYFPAPSREVPELTYFVHPAKAAVVRTGQTSRLSAQFDGQNLTGDVTATQIAVWNAGRRSIRSGNVLQPLIIRTGNNVRILEARLQKVSREVVGLTLDLSRLSSGEVGISWNILEHNDGGVVQIIYSGDENVEIEAKAVLEGQPELFRLTYARPLSTPNEQYIERQDWQVRLLVFLVLGMVPFLLVMSILRLLERKQIAQARWYVIWAWRLLEPGLLIITAAMICAAIWIFFYPVPFGPPFGF